MFGVWGGIALVSGIAALVGYVLFADMSPEVIAATTAVAAGAILAMLADTMIPEAFENAHDFAGLDHGRRLPRRVRADQARRPTLAARRRRRACAGRTRRSTAGESFRR